MIDPFGIGCCARVMSLLSSPLPPLPPPPKTRPGKIDRPEFATDDFRMHRFKIDLCPDDGAPHDLTACPWAHEGEKARRRDPRRFAYSGAACPDFRKGVCKRGDACTYGHGVFECWLHPSR